MEFLIIFICSLFNMVSSICFSLLNNIFHKNFDTLSSILIIISSFILIIYLKKLKEKFKLSQFNKAFIFSLITLILDIVLFIIVSTMNITNNNILSILTLISSFFIIFLALYANSILSSGISKLYKEKSNNIMFLKAETISKYFLKIFIFIIIYFVLLIFASIVSNTLLIILLIALLVFMFFALYVQISFLKLLWDCHKVFDTK